MCPYEIYKIFKVGCGVQIWQKTFFQNTEKLYSSFIKNGIILMNLIFIYKNPIILGPLKIATLIDFLQPRLF